MSLLLFQGWGAAQWRALAEHERGSGFCPQHREKKNCAEVVATDVAAPQFRAKGREVRSLPAIPAPGKQRQEGALWETIPKEKKRREEKTRGKEGQRRRGEGREEKSEGGTEGGREKLVVAKC
jgi:hypothetical protein